MLENILKADWLEKNPRYAFFIGFIYSIIGIISALIIFPKSKGIASIAFLSLLLVPSLNKILKIEEIQDTKSKNFSLKRIFKDHYDVIEVYLLLFLGIFLAYGLFSIRFPDLLVGGLFDNQLKVIGITGFAEHNSLSFSSIFKNNLKVWAIFLVLSLIIGAGSIFFLAWNASVWGVVFAFSSLNSGNAFDAFTNIFIKVAPHMITEASAYFFAIVAGGIMSQAVLREKIDSAKFRYVLKDGLVFTITGLLLLILGAALEVYLF